MSVHVKSDFSFSLWVPQQKGNKTTRPNVADFLLPCETFDYRNAEKQTEVS